MIGFTSIKIIFAYRFTSTKQAEYNIRNGVLCSLALSNESHKKILDNRRKIEPLLLGTSRCLLIDIVVDSDLHNCNYLLLPFAKLKDIFLISKLFGGNLIYTLSKE